MEAVTGTLLAPGPYEKAPGMWVDVLTQKLVRVELRESTLAPETDTERVHRAAASAQQARPEPRHGPFGPPGTTGLTDPEDAARLFGQRHGGRWRPVDWSTW